MASNRAYFEGPFVGRGNELNLLIQVSGEQDVSVDTSRSGMLVATVQLMTKQKGDL